MEQGTVIQQCHSSWDEIKQK